jgi:GH43 family beta-xylosidase
MIPDGSVTLKATVEPANATNQMRSWKSDDETVATVTVNGRVTAVNFGKANITIKTADGGFEATCKVTVSKEVVVGDPVLFGDPFILYHDGVYYAYGTSYAVSSDDGIEVYTSTDMISWKPTERRFALYKTDTWTYWRFWAPEVYHVNGKFYMYFSGWSRMCVATADNPLGPFRQEPKQPMTATDFIAIDHSLFIDDDGKPYLFFVREIKEPVYGLEIWVAELETNLTAIKTGTMQKCIETSQQWEMVAPRVNEGPFVVKHNGIYFMTYSGNGYESPSYGIGVATATNIFGTWTKYDQNPIYQSPGDLAGIGHSSMFTDKDGKLRIVFHSHYSKTSIHPRVMHISAVNFIQENGKEIMTIDPNYITPVLKNK